MTTATIRNALVGIADTVSKKGDQFTVRRGFYYGNGMNAEFFAEKVAMTLLNNGMRVEITNYGEIYKPFKGGAPVSKQSHWFAVFKLI